VHNLMTGRIVSRPEPRRSTPYHKAHATALAGLSITRGGDDRFYNNILIGAGEAPKRPAAGADAALARVAGFGLWVYDTREAPLATGGNVYFDGAERYARERGALVVEKEKPAVRVVEEGGAVYLELDAGGAIGAAQTAPVTTAMLGKTRVSGLGYENADGSPLTVDTDYFGKRRDARRPSAGPVEGLGKGRVRIRVWPQ
jgi:hypothetical protein